MYIYMLLQMLILRAFKSLMHPHLCVLQLIANWCWICGKDLGDDVYGHYSPDPENTSGCPGMQFTPENQAGVDIYL